MLLVKTTQLTLVFGCIIATSCSQNKDISFAKNVMPIFNKNCLSCHQTGGIGYAASGFSVESYESIMKGTKFGPVIKKGFS